jgi:hypothetical protein
MSNLSAIDTSRLLKKQPNNAKRNHNKPGHQW